MTNDSHENRGNNVGNKLLVSYYCLKKKQLSCRQYTGMCDVVMCVSEGFVHR